MTDHTQARRYLRESRENYTDISYYDVIDIVHLVASLDAEIAALKAKLEPFKFLPDCPREGCYLYGCPQENCDWLAAKPKPPEGA